MCYFNQAGSIVWANNEYWDATGHPPGEEERYNLSWLGAVLNDDRPKALALWKRLSQGERVTPELRLQKKYIPQSGEPESATLLLNAFPTLENGVVTSVNCFTTDISNLKWAQAAEARNTAEALEAKRKQEEFMDLVSHELRNPLSAIFQLADSVINSSPILRGATTTEADMADTIKNNTENASTILMCAKPQKRIVDDVLTLSKLEYTMVSVAPRPVQLSALVTQSLKMFEAELLENDIKVKLGKCREAGEIGCVICDESRVQQVLINLITNATKFTKTETRREIEVRYGATLSEPRKITSENINWAPNKTGMADLTLNPEWGLGEPLYPTFIVMDTGVGMTSDEIAKLFSRFEQAN
jgi:signal transduction histidine kinase